MKKKDDKVAGYLTNASNTTDVLNVIYLPEHSEAKAPTDWLKLTVSKERELLLSQSGGLGCELFLHSVLYPLIERDVELDEQLLTDRLVDYKKSSPGFGSDFEVSNMIGNILNHFQFYSADEVEEQPGHSPQLDKDLRLFMMLCDLDLKAIDETVRKRINQG
jgi:hypothetical protein